MTGAGLSAWAGYPLWRGALQRLADLVTAVTRDTRRGADLIAQNIDLLFCAQRLGQVLGEAEFSAFIAREFGPNGRVPPNVLLHFALLPLRHIVTLNFDLSCEEAHTAANVAFRSLSSSSNEALAGFFREMDYEACPKTIFHLHGQFNDPLATIALTEQGYQRRCIPKGPCSSSLQEPGDLKEPSVCRLRVYRQRCDADLLQMWTPRESATRQQEPFFITLRSWAGSQ